MSSKEDRTGKLFEEIDEEELMTCILKIRDCNMKEIKDTINSGSGEYVWCSDDTVRFINAEVTLLAYKSQLNLNKQVNELKNSQKYLNVLTFVLVAVTMVLAYLTYLLYTKTI